MLLYSIETPKKHSLKTPTGEAFTQIRFDWWDRITIEIDYWIAMEFYKGSSFIKTNIYRIHKKEVVKRLLCMSWLQFGWWEFLPNFEYLHLCVIIVLITILNILKTRKSYFKTKQNNYLNTSFIIYLYFFFNSRLVCVQFYHYVCNTEETFLQYFRIRFRITRKYWKHV